MNLFHRLITQDVAEDHEAHLPQMFALPESSFRDGDAWADHAAVVFCEMGLCIDSESGAAEVPKIG